MCVVDSHRSFLSPYCSSCIWLKSSSLVTLHRLPCAYCTKPRFLRLTNIQGLLFAHPRLLSSSMLVTPSPWSRLEASPSPVRTLTFPTQVSLLLPFLLPSIPPSLQLLSYCLYPAEIFNQCYLLGILLNMPWQMETHPCPAGRDWHTRSWKSR